jgi:hypothetical protein
LTPAFALTVATQFAVEAPRRRRITSAVTVAAHEDVAAALTNVTTSAVAVVLDVQDATAAALTNCATWADAVTLDVQLAVADAG